MERLYKILNFSRQALHQHVKKRMIAGSKRQQLIEQIRAIRREHPRLSCRKLYRILKPGFMGRDRFENFCYQNGFKLYRKRSFHRTTDSRGVTRFDNLVAGREVTHANQVWVSDITYYRIEEKFYYITLIMDQFSRSIVGYSVSRTLHAETTTLPALNKAVKERRPPKGLIIHSDGGGQYYCTEFKDLTGKWKMLNSMGKCAYDNPYAERLNGTIKNDYLQYYGPSNFIELKHLLKRAVDNYNHRRPHTSLWQMTPVEFETNTNTAFGTNTKKDHRTEKVFTE